MSCRTPYGRLTAKLTRRREAENSEWLARGGPAGDPRRTGADAFARMHQRLRYDMADIEPGMLKLAMKWFNEYLLKKEKAAGAL